MLDVLIKGHLTPFCACAAVWFLIRRNSFQSWYLSQKSFSIDLTRRVKLVIPTLNDCLVIYERFKRHILFWVEYRRELRFPWEGDFEADRDDNYFRFVAVLFRKKTKTKKRWEDEHPRSDVHSSWKKVKGLYLYSTDIAFTQHKHMINILCKQKVKCQRIKRFSKGTWNSKLTRGDFVARVIVLRFLLVKKNWCQSRPHMHDNGPSKIPKNY